MPDDASANRMTTDTLVELARTLRDSEQGYRTAADDTADPQLKSIFNGLARTRAEQADALEAQIRGSGGQPAARGTMSGALHRYFMDLKSALAGYDRLAVLEEVARGEAYAEAAFDGAKREPLGPEVRKVVQRLHDGVKASRDRFRAMARAEGGGADGLWERATARMSRLGDAVYRQAPARFGDVTGYMAERPLATTLAALGVGFALGAMAVTLLRPGGPDR